MKTLSRLKHSSIIVSILIIMLCVIFTIPVSYAYAESNIATDSFAEKIEFTRGFETFEYDKTITKKIDRKYFKFELYKGAQYRLYLKALTSPVYWAGAESQPSQMTVSWTTTTSVAETNSYSISVKLGLKIPSIWGECSGSIEGTVSNSVTYSVAEATQYAVQLDRSSTKGYYALTSAINAYKYEIRIRGYSDAEMTKLTDDYGYNYAYIYSTSMPYVYLRYKSSAMTSNDFYFAL